MAITFTYTESTNKVVVTEGTSGTPATFADFVTADRAGTDTDLLVAGSPASDLALTYAVRSVEDLAILVKCVVANKTAEADFIFITGTDWRGAAQTESIDVTAGNGSYTSTKYWASITTLDCSDNAAGGGTVWADGDLSVTQDIWGVIWDYGSGQYRVDAIFDIGDGSTATHFSSRNEAVFFSGVNVSVTSAAFLYLGQVVSSAYTDGSFWDLYMANSDTTFVASGGTYKIVASRIRVRCQGTWKQLKLNGASGSLIRASVIENTGTNNNYLSFNTTNDDIGPQVYTTGFNLIFWAIPNNVDDVYINDAAIGVRNFGQIITVSNLKWSNITTEMSLGGYNSQLTAKNPEQNISTVSIQRDGTSIHEDYTCDVHVANKDGTNLSGAVVDCEDKNGTAVWTAGSVTTAADGTITQQSITYQKWEDAAMTKTVLSPHKFTISKAGYETLVLDAITVDGKIDWHLELLAQKQSPAPWQEGMM